MPPTLPALDRSHPINRGAVFGWDARAPLRDLIGNAQGMAAGDITLGDTGRKGEYGRKFDGSWYYECGYNFGDNPNTNTLHYTPATWVFYYRQTDSENISLACHCDYFTAGGWTIGAYYGSAYNIRLELIRSSQDVRRQFTVPSIGHHVLIITYDGGEAYEGINAYFDGVAAADAGDNLAGSGTSAPVAAGDPLFISCNRFESASSFNGTIYCARFFNRVLSLAEIRALSNDPYLGYVTPTQIEVTSSGGTEYTASPSESFTWSDGAGAVATLVAPAGESVSVGDSLTGVVAALTSAAESWTVAEGLTALPVAIAALSEGWSWLEALDAAGAAVGELGESTSWGDALSAGLAAAAALVESPTIADALQAAASALLELGDAVTFGGALGSILGALASETEEWAWAAEILAEGSGAYSAVLSESVTWGEALGSLQSGALALGDSLTLSGALAAGNLITASPAETVTWADTLVTVGAFAQALSEIHSWSDVAQVAAQVATQLDDTWTVADALQAGRLLMADLSEALDWAAQQSEVSTDDLHLSESVSTLAFVAAILHTLLSYSVKAIQVVDDPLFVIAFTEDELFRVDVTSDPIA